MECRSNIMYESSSLVIIYVPSIRMANWVLCCGLLLFFFFFVSSSLSFLLSFSAFIYLFFFFNLSYFHLIAKLWDECYDLRCTFTRLLTQSLTHSLPYYPFRLFWITVTIMSYWLTVVSSKRKFKPTFVILLCHKMRRILRSYVVWLIIIFHTKDKRLVINSFLFLMDVIICCLKNCFAVYYKCIKSYLTPLKLRWQPIGHMLW